MPVSNSIAAMAGTLAEWRQDFHRHPELAYQETRTARVVAERLDGFGLDEVRTGLGGTGVLGVLHGHDGPGGPVIMLRADMDALPITEATGAAHASTNAGVMHACGHDGHTTMLLGAARHLAETRNFSGTVWFCFQPAEEGHAGAKAMLEDGLFREQRPRAAYGLHNWPGLPVGQMAVKPGPVLAAGDELKITVRGLGGHGAMPHTTRDPVLAASAIVCALQGIVAREVDPRDPAVISVTEVKAGFTHNVIPDTAFLHGSCRAHDDRVMDELRAAVARVAKGVAEAHGCTAEIGDRGSPYPATVNDPEQAAVCHGVMADLLGAENAHPDHPTAMASEDFSFFAQQVPAAFAIIGNGATAALHHPEYDFDDAALPIGTAYWVRLVETALPA